MVEFRSPNKFECGVANAANNREATGTGANSLGDDAINTSTFPMAAQPEEETPSHMTYFTRGYTAAATPSHSID